MHRRFQPSYLAWTLFLVATLLLGCGESATDPGRDDRDGGDVGGGGQGGDPLNQEGAWMWANPRPQGDPVWRVQFASEDVVYAVTAGASVLKSTDAGRNWEVAYAVFSALRHPHSALNGLHFLDASEGWVAGSRGQIAHTDDGGQSWDDRSLDNERNVHDVHFVDALTGFAVGNRGLLQRTDDGGLSWTPVAHLFGDVSFNAVAFDGAGNGWIGGDDGLALHSDDGGNSWTQIPGVWRGDIGAADALDGVGVVFCSDAGGLALVQAPNRWNYIFGADSIMDAHFEDADNGMALYLEDGLPHLGVLEDGNWQHDEIPFEQTAFTFDVRGKQLALGGWMGAMAHSSNAGANWHDAFEQAPLAAPWSTQLMAVDVEGELAIAAGWGGITLRSTDGGIEWEALENGSSEDLWDASIAHGLAFVAGDNNTLLRSSDQGQSWTEANTEGEGFRFYEVQMFDAQNGVLAGGGGLQMTEDGGLNWTLRAIPLPDHIEATFCASTVGDQHAWLGARSGHVVRTVDGGENWTLHDTGAYRAIQSICFVDEMHGWAGTDSQEFVYTTDGGATWTELWVIGPFRDIDFVNAKVGIAVATTGGVYGTVDGGLTWEQQVSALTTWSHVRGVAMDSENDALIVGTESKILYTRTGGWLPPQQLR